MKNGVETPEICVCLCLTIITNLHQNDQCVYLYHVLFFVPPSLTTESEILRHQKYLFLSNCHHHVKRHHHEWPSTVPPFVFYILCCTVLYCHARDKYINEAKKKMDVENADRKSTHTDIHAYSSGRRRRRRRRSHFPLSSFSVLKCLL